MTLDISARVRGGAVMTVFTAAATLAGCGAFGPSRTPPTLPMPDHYAASAVGAPSGTATASAASPAPTQAVAPVRPVPQWWQAFGSPTLDDLVSEGLDHSPSLAAARSTLEAARQTLKGQIGQNMFPTVDVGFDPSRQRALGIPILPQQTFLENIFAAEVQASYTFDFFGASVLANRALAEQVREQALQVESTRRALATNIVVATINAASLQAQVDETVALVALGEQRAAQIAARYARGSASHDEMLAAEQDAANTAATLPPLRAQALAVRHAQAVLLGRMPDQAPVPLALPALQLSAEVPLSIPSELLHQRPDIRAAEAAVRAAADEAGAATAAMFPTMTLSAAYGHGGFDWSTFTSPAGVIWSFGASLTQPLFRGGALLARRRQYQASYEAAVSQYKQTVLSAFQSVADTLVSLDEDQDSLAQAERAASAARGLHHDTEARYRLGATPYYATLTAGQQWHSAEIQSIRARAARLADTAALFDAMGDPPAEGAKSARNP